MKAKEEEDTLMKELKERIEIKKAEINLTRQEAAVKAKKKEAEDLMKQA